MGLPILFRGEATAPGDVTGSGASTLSFASSGTAQEIMQGTGASALSFASVGTAAEEMRATGASELSFASSGTALEEMRGSGASTLSFASSGTGSGGSEPTEGSGSSELAYASSGTGEAEILSQPADTHDGAPRKSSSKRKSTRKRPLPLPQARRTISTEENAAAMARHQAPAPPEAPAEAPSPEGVAGIASEPSSGGEPEKGRVRPLEVTGRAISLPQSRDENSTHRLDLEPLELVQRDRAAVDELLEQVRAEAEAQAEAARRMKWLLREDEEILALLLTE